MIEKINQVCDRIIPDSLIDGILATVFSKPSLIVHTVWFLVWFLAHLNVSLLTNIVSLEAIYLGALIGIQQLRHHEETKDMHETTQELIAGHVDTSELQSPKQ